MRRYVAISAHISVAVGRTLCRAALWWRPKDACAKISKYLILKDLEQYVTEIFFYRLVIVIHQKTSTRKVQARKISSVIRVGA